MSTSTYQIGGCLPPDAKSYVKRSADEELYKLLQAGEFCYVLNSRQMGKSSLRVQTMKRLQKDGLACASVDITELGTQQVTPEKWYGGLTKTLVSRLGLEERFSFRTWRDEHRDIPPVQFFREFIEEVLLIQIAQPIVIFIDEIDSVLQLGFKDDFFALIRACFNNRAENKAYNRLSFVLLGVATPGDLIEDKNRTPFNIGRAIELHGFQWHEVEPLVKGLEGWVNHPEVVIQEILNWTGGQPFLTQKLCQLVCDYSHTIPVGAERVGIEKLVRVYITSDWEKNDEPEHLKTIRNRTLSNEQRAAYLLELYQQVWQQGEVIANNSFEEGKLQLSGLVVKHREGTSPVLTVYNRIYYEVFNQDWIEQELAALRPYSEAFRAWVASGGLDESRLLRGKALQDAQAWGKGKNLSYLDQQFLAASEKKGIEEQIAVEKKEAELERERKDREAADKRNQVLTEANRKAKRRIQIGAVVLIVAVLGAIVSGLLAGSRVVEAKRQVDEAHNDLKQAQNKAAEEQQKTKQAQQELSFAKGEIENIQQKAQNLERQQKQKTEELNQANKELFSLDKQREQAERDATEAQFEADKAIENEAKAKQETEKAIAETHEYLEDAKNTQVRLERLETDYRDKQEEVEQITAKIYSIGEAHKNLTHLANLADKLYQSGKPDKASEVRERVGLVYQVQQKSQDYELTQALLLADISLAYQYLEEWDKAERAINQSLSLLPPQADVDSLSQQSAIFIYVLITQGHLLNNQGKIEGALAIYKEAFSLLNNTWKKLPKFDDISTEISIPHYLPQKQPILSAGAIESLHLEFILLREETIISPYRIGKGSKSLDLVEEIRAANYQIRESLKLHYLAKVKFFLESGNWKDADINTTELIIVIAGHTITLANIDARLLSCQDLRTIDKLWVERSGGKFGFSVQKSILHQFISQPEWEQFTDFYSLYQGILKWDKFYDRTGWKDESLREELWPLIRYEEGVFNPKKAVVGHLPGLAVNFVSGMRDQVFARIATCGM